MIRRIAGILGAVGLAALALALSSETAAARHLAAALPVLAVLALMVGLGWGGHQAGPAGWLIGLVVGWAVFGLTFEVWWVSQLKGLLLSGFVLAVLWPALYLYHIVAEAGGIRALATALQALIRDRGLLLIVMTWAFSGMLEGLAGFGLPVAIVAPMLVSLGVPPVAAVAAVAVGHAWSVTFGDMGVIFQTLTGLVDADEGRLAATAAALLGAACLATGLSAARILGQGRRWPAVLPLAAVMSAVQYELAVTGLTPLAAFGAGLAGILCGALLSATWHRSTSTANPSISFRLTPSLLAAAGAYGGLAALLSAITLIPALNDTLRQVIWKASFPQVATTDGFMTEAGSGQAIRPLVHPGAAILLVAILSYAVYRRRRMVPPGGWRIAAGATWRSAMPATIGIVSMVGLSTLMDHTGMTQRLAGALADLLDTAFPLVSALVGMLGAFATGSNNNSNVLFASLQEEVALLLGIAPGLLAASQTTGGALGSMIAPAKIIVGCSTVGLQGRDGDVLRVTLPYGLAIGLGIGALALVASVV